MGDNHPVVHLVPEAFPGELESRLRTRCGIELPAGNLVWILPPGAFRFESTGLVVTWWPGMATCPHCGVHGTD